jgi:hypothetical protein
MVILTPFSVFSGLRYYFNGSSFQSEFYRLPEKERETETETERERERERMRIYDKRVLNASNLGPLIYLHLKDLQSFLEDPKVFK